MDSALPAPLAHAALAVLAIAPLLVQVPVNANIVLTGGTAGFATLRDRLEKEVADLAPQMAKVKVGAARCAARRAGRQHCVRACAGKEQHATSKPLSCPQPLSHSPTPHPYAGGVPRGPGRATVQRVDRGKHPCLPGNLPADVDVQG